MSRPRKPKDFWNDSETTPEDIKRATANRQRVLKELIEHALTSEPLDASRVAQWHKDCFSGLSYVGMADQCLLGAYRGTSHPRLKAMEVSVSGIFGAAAHEVHGELVRFFSQLQKRMSSLAAEIEVEQDKSQEELRQIAEVAGWAHGEWVRIHPFANGSGRTAKLIANWVLSRFRLLPVVGIRPRPEHPYAPAAVASMHGNHSKITQFIVDLLEDPPS
jgi:Fic family protein